MTDFFLSLLSDERATSEQWHIPLENSRGPVFVSCLWCLMKSCPVFQEYKNISSRDLSVCFSAYLCLLVCLFITMRRKDQGHTWERERLETHLCLCEYLSLIISSLYCMSDQSKEEKLSFLNSTWRAVRLVCWWWHFSWMCRCVSAVRCEELLSFSDMIFILRQIWLVYLVLTAHTVYNPPLSVYVGIKAFHFCSTEAKMMFLPFQPMMSCSHSFAFCCKILAVI